MANLPRIQWKAAREPGQGPKELRDHATTGVSRSSDRGSQVGRWAPMSPHPVRTCRTWSEELGGAPGIELHSGRYCTHCHSFLQSPRRVSA
ncbi:pH signal transduction protein PalI [Aspergillus luchuensis]|uniref:pH signal transduction protein PalI n=1 Tax=Aspergillus kawachii TaxID=1069201 RepID=A0A146FI27_ASPKA|nr:pH signal transduction protein PalI [Aspergillus luchuensis]